MHERTPPAQAMQAPVVETEISPSHAGVRRGQPRLYRRAHLKQIYARGRLYNQGLR
jgi:hypothetical protein